MAQSVVNGATPVNSVHELHLEGLANKIVSTEIESSLPSEFYQSRAIYQLERRAIFSRRWFLVSHKARYREVGDFVQYDMAGFNFVVVKNKEGAIVGFHNMCRWVPGLLLVYSFQMDLFSVCFCANP